MILQYRQAGHTQATTGFLEVLDQLCCTHEAYATFLRELAGKLALPVVEVVAQDGTERLTIRNVTGIKVAQHLGAAECRRGLS
ncbi:hypothetical protein D3C84_943910 [compost metagenome]